MKLPTQLYSAFDWTDAAGELLELACTPKTEVEGYAQESSTNARNHGESVDPEDIKSLRAWLVTNARWRVEAPRGNVWKGPCAINEARQAAKLARRQGHYTLIHYAGTAHE